MEICWFWEHGCEIDFAAWIQAIGTIVAIAAVGITAKVQSRDQHASSLQVSENERRDSKLAISAAVLGICQAATKAMEFTAKQLSDRDVLHGIAEGTQYFHRSIINDQAENLKAIPLHSLPSESLIRAVIMITSLALQFDNKIQQVLRIHRDMDADSFHNFFKDLDEISSASSNITSDIRKEIATY